MKQKIPAPVFVGVIVVAIAVIGYIMYSRAVPPQRAPGSPSNLERAAEAMQKSSGQPMLSEKFRHRKD